MNDSTHSPAASESLRSLAAVTGIAFAVWRKKATDQRRNHAKSLKVTVRQLVNWGWTDDRMTRDLMHAYTGDCPGIYCGHVAFSSLTLRELTVDIRDVNAPAVWGVNTTLMCHKCNRAKFRKTVEAVIAEAIRFLASVDDDEQLKFDF